MRYVSPDGLMLAITGILRLAASKSSRPTAWPARRPMARMCTTALVEQPMAIATLMAFWNAALVMMPVGVRSSHTMSTMRRPAAEHMRAWLLSAAGIDEVPGRQSPSTSASAVMVAAVPMVMHTP